MQGFTRRLERDAASPPPERRLCQGTLLSREQYLADITRWGYEDGRLMPHEQMTAEDVERWTAAIDPGKGGDDAPGSRR